MTIRPCTHAQSRQAVERWHYTAAVPPAVIGRFGIWEDGHFVGSVIFGWGANRHIGRQFGLGQGEVVELTRVALAPGRKTRTSAVVAACLRRLHQDHPQVRLVVSYADPNVGHVGVLYQSLNAAYLGLARGSRPLVIAGRTHHARSVYERYGTCSLPRLRAIGVEATVVVPPPKHKYAWGLDGHMRRRLRRLAQPYPRAAKESMATRPPARREGVVRSHLAAPGALASLGVKGDGYFNTTPPPKPRPLRHRPPGRSGLGHRRPPPSDGPDVTAHSPVSCGRRRDPRTGHRPHRT